MPIFITVVAVALAAAHAPDPAPAAHPTDAEVAAWYKFRQTKFAELKAADPNQPAEIAAIKARAAAAVAAAGPPATSLDAPPVIYPTGRASPLVLYEDPAAPRMAVVPAGEFTMGSPDRESGRALSEGPRRRVRIAYPLAVGLFPIVYGEYALFVADTRRAASGRCVMREGGRSTARDGRDWRDTGFPQTVRHPVTCVSVADANAYAAWVSRRTGHHYRLLSEAEYEWAERAGTTTAYSWGDAADAACGYANGLDQDAAAATSAVRPIGCRDGYRFTSPAGSLKPNAFGLFDTAGNVSSWTADCWTETLSRAPGDGSPNRRGDCGRRVVRGGSWSSADLRAAFRVGDPVGYVGADHGFRLARDL